MQIQQAMFQNCKRTMELSLQHEGETMKTLTAAEIEKLPSCIHDKFSYCPEENHPNMPLLFCLEKCTLPDMRRAIVRQDNAVVMSEFDTLVQILLKMKVLKHE